MGYNLNSLMHDRYYEPEDYDDRTDEIEERAWQLMKVGAKFDWRTAGRISEALSDMGTEQAESLQAIIDEGDYAKIGLKIMMMSEEYMKHFAIRAAESEIDD